MKIFANGLSTRALLAGSLGLFVSLSAAAAPPERTYGKGAPFTVDDLPPGLLKQDLQGLPGSERARAMRWLHSFRFPAADAAVIRADSEGGIYVADTNLPEAVPSAEAAGSPAAEAISASDTFALHSKPGASKVIFVDVDGHTITGTAWNSDHSTLEAKAYDTDGDPAVFSAAELDKIAEMWHRIAEDFAAFDVDVTTEEPTVFTPQTGRILITDNYDANGNPMPASGAGGVAYVDVFGTPSYTYYSPALVYANNLGDHPPHIAEAASHEMGHNMGLSHHGVTGSSYYGGHGSGWVSWGPIMGTGYTRNVSQWSKGEFNNATNDQDDIVLIAGKVGMRSDDHGNSLGAATSLAVASDGSVTVTHTQDDPLNSNPVNKGIINSTSDVDMFAFSAGAGTIDLTVTPSWKSWPRNGRGTNLDVLVTLYDAAGNPVASSDPEDNTDAHISANVAAGDYVLAITGVGNAISPYSDYGSQGQYYINGQVPPAVTGPDTTPPNPNPMSWAAAPAATGTDSMSMTASTASDNSGAAVQYYFRCLSAGCSDSGWQASSSYSASGLQADTSYSWTVKARDEAGNETAESATASATTDGEPDTTAPNPNPMGWSAVPAATGQTGVTMSAITATDDSGSAVQYYFSCVSGGAGCDDSGWQGSSSYTDNGLQAATTYSWTVKARDAAGNETAASTAAAATTDAAPQPPVAPSGLVASDNSDGTAGLSWADNSSDETGFEVVRESWHRKRNRWRSTTLVATTGENVNSLNDASGNGLYRYRVRAVNGAGNSAYSAWVEVTVTTAGGGGGGGNGGGNGGGGGGGGCKGGPKKCG